MPLRGLMLLVLSVIFTASVAPAYAVTFSLDPRTAYLRIGNSEGVVLNALIIDLSANAFAAGDTILIDQFGDYKQNDAAEIPDVVTSLGGVFSSSATLLAASNLNRVPGAIDAGVDVPTGPTFFGAFPTDIPQDFRIDPEVQITIPSGALYLFVGIIDSYWSDNRDPDMDFGVSVVRAVPEPATEVLLLTGLAGVLTWSRRRRANPS